MDSYQATYDAVRSRLSNCDVGRAVEAAVTLQIGSASFFIDRFGQEALRVLGQQERPSVLYRPALMADGTAWCALYGEDLQSGIAGFGDTPERAMQAFDEAWMREQTPAAVRAALAKGAEADV